LSFCGLAAAYLSSWATTSTTAIATGAGGGAGTEAGITPGGGVYSVRVGVETGSAAADFNPSFSSIELKNPMVCPCTF
jgi:hypothetical protein